MRLPTARRAHSTSAMKKKAATRKKGRAGKDVSIGTRATGMYKGSAKARAQRRRSRTGLGDVWTEEMVMAKNRTRGGQLKDDAWMTCWAKEFGRRQTPQLVEGHRR